MPCGKMDELDEKMDYFLKNTAIKKPPLKEGLSYASKKEERLMNRCYLQHHAGSVRT